MLFCVGQKWETFVAAVEMTPSTALDMQRHLRNGESFAELCRAFLPDPDKAFAEFEKIYGSPYIDVTKQLLLLPSGISLREALQFHMAEVREKDSRFIVSSAPLSSSFEKRLLEKGSFAFAYGDAAFIDAGILATQLPSSKTNESAHSEMLQLSSGSSLSDVDGLIRELIWHALMARASDIHIQGGEMLSIHLRIDGEVRPFWRLPKSRHTTLLNRLKILSGMNIAERVLPQDGRFSVQNVRDVIDVRSATMQTRDGEKMVLRLLPQRFRFHDLKELGLSVPAAEKMMSLSLAPHGLFIFSGPANSGKTTVLYTLLRQIVKRPLAVYSIEDPIESVVEGVHQIQINRLRTLDFATALRGVLRMDPDVVMIGELRDAVSAEIAIRAALTGHLVLATLHTYDAQSVVSRLEDLGVSRELIANALLAICNQRLLPKQCELCHGSGISHGVTCVSCGGYGRYGRTVVQECWQPDASERSLIRRGADPLQLRENAINKGFHTLYHDAMEKVRQGLLSDAVLRSALGGGSVDGEI